MGTESKSSRDTADEATKPSSGKPDAGESTIAKPEPEAPDTESPQEETGQVENDDLEDRGGAGRSYGWFNDPRSKSETARRGWWDRG
ncbi:MAG TPA: hypothetical protein VFR77_00645 [Steroidobacteraceae bacterium]|nr:hypothetical protein [Steroidobacteraceae bacterium]